jgi:hypothetical protein
VIKPAILSHGDVELGLKEAPLQFLIFCIR